MDQEALQSDRTLTTVMERRHSKKSQGLGKGAAAGRARFSVLQAGEGERCVMEGRGVLR